MSSMSDHQEAHLKFLVYKFTKLAGPKYRAGAAEHNGNLFDVSKEELLDFAIEEAIDQVIYLLSLKYGAEFAGLIAGDYGVTKD